MKRDIWWRQQKCWHGKKIFDVKSFFLSWPIHFVISVQIRGFFWFLFSRDPKSPHSVRIRENRKYGPEKTPYLDTFHLGIPTLMLIFTMILKSFKIISIDSIWLLTVTDKIFYLNRTMVRRKKHANEFSFCLSGFLHTKRNSDKMGLDISARLLL